MDLGEFGHQFIAFDACNDLYAACCILNSRTVRLWCGAPPGRRKCRHWLCHFSRTTCRSTSEQRPSMPTTTYCRLLTSALRRRSPSSQCTGTAHAFSFRQRTWLRLFWQRLSSVALCTLRKPSDLGVVWHVCLWLPIIQCKMWVPDRPQQIPKVYGYFWVESQWKYAFANCCCHLSNRNVVWFCVLPNYFLACYVV